MTSEKKKKILSELWEWVKSLSFALLVGIVILTFARPSLVIGPSMQPTLEDKDLLLLEKFSYIKSDPQRGDIVVIKTDEPLFAYLNKNIIKRVIGLPGDTILITSDKVFINGDPLDEDYLKDEIIKTGFAGKVPDNHVFVLGDNRNMSSDSRDDKYGFIPYNQIQGKAYIRIYPFKRIGAM